MQAGSATSGHVHQSERRADIDGLRAIAVGGVVAFHFGLTGVTGGYTGVDVFFVISGYLIAGIIAREVAAGTYTVGNFYARRIRRIMPAVTVMAVVSAIMAFALLLPEDLKEFGRSWLSIATFSSNYYFVRKTDYFGGNADEMPLLHTWSLAIEEQYYIMFPVLFVWLLGRGRLFAISTLAVLAMTSWVYGFLLMEDRPALAFFSTLSRIWELLAGAVLALAPAIFAGKRPVRELMALAGLGMILESYVLLDRNTDFPGLAALLPCAGTLLLISSATAGDTAISRLLSLRPVTDVGLMSYSIYLWHWPILAFTRYRFPELFSSSGVAGVSTGLALLAVTMAISFLSWRFIEQPFRSAPALQSPGNALKFATLTTLVLSVSAFALHRSSGFWWRWPDSVRALSQWDRPDRGGKITGCESFESRFEWPGRVCRAGAKDHAPATLVWGDSHARRLAAGLVKFQTGSDPSFILASKPGCPPLIGVELYGRSKSRSCLDFNQQLLAAVQAEGLKTVIIAARWSFYTEGTRYGQEGGNSALLSDGGLAENAGIVFKALDQTIRSLRERGANVIIVGPVPEQKFHVTPMMLKMATWNRPPEPALQYNEMLERQAKILGKLDQIDKSGLATVVYPHKLLCDEKECPYQKAGEPLYSDNDHLTDDGLRVIEPLLRQLIRVLK